MSLEHLNQDDFDAFMERVISNMRTMFGVVEPPHDLYNFRDAFEDGMSPYDAALAAYGVISGASHD
jgi:hypothetical protein